MVMRVGFPGPSKADINVTPLVDVLLVLLIIFMVVTPLIRMGYDVSLPPEGRPPIALLESVILGVGAAECPAARAAPGASDFNGDCRVRINGELLDLSRMGSRLAEIFRRRSGPDRVLFVAAEERLNYEAVLRLIDRARRAAGPDLRIAIATDESLATRGRP